MPDWKFGPRRVAEAGAAVVAGRLRARASGTPPASSVLVADDHALRAHAEAVAEADLARPGDGIMLLDAVADGGDLRPLPEPVGEAEARQGAVRRPATAARRARSPRCRGCRSRRAPRLARDAELRVRVPRALLWNDELGNGDSSRKFSSKFTQAVSVGNVKQCAAVITSRGETAVAEHENCRLRAKPTYGCAPLSSSRARDRLRRSVATTSSASAVRAPGSESVDFKMTSPRGCARAHVCARIGAVWMIRRLATALWPLPAAAHRAPSLVPRRS